MIRGFPNGETLIGRRIVCKVLAVSSDSAVKTTRGSETSQYPEEKKSNEIPLVVASERGTAQTVMACMAGLQGRPVQNRGVTNRRISRTVLERPTIEGDSPVCENAQRLRSEFLSTTGHVKSGGNLGRPLSKAKYSLGPIVNKYREGKAKRTPDGE